ncbi:MAG TPA: peptidoglycan-binding protein [Actinomycetota bacterium]|nr:peptidoglycan-binding protein [Actinomycetota bacterium]
MDLIRRGHRGKAVADLQSRLEKLDFVIDPSELGGTFGPSTEMAIKEFQQKSGLDVDGIVGDATWKALVETSWRLGDRPLRLSQPFLRGDDVRELQAQLNALGFTAGKHDGIFGLGTAAALRDFQRNLAVDEDGIVGHETLRALERLRMVIKPGLGPRITEREARRADPPGLAGKRIVLDPGHGGEETGGVAPDGETEADWVFRLSAKLGLLLDERRAHPVLTRGPNDGPTESQRAQLANRFAADLLLSIHLNSHSKPIAAGAATYYFQGGTVASEPGEYLAELIQQALISAGRTDCSTHGKAYPILRETQMPAVVVEPGFITNPEEFKELTESMDELAAAMLDALERYFSEPD